MTTTQKIQAVLATGNLGLPEGLEFRNEYEGWTLEGSGTCADCIFEIGDQQAFDLIAMHWARAVWSDDMAKERESMNGTALERFDDAMADGDSDAAISAIYEALCGGKQ